MPDDPYPPIPAHDSPPARGPWAVVLWGAFLGGSWAWAIGMALPALLLRDFGAWGWGVVALANMLGVAAVGVSLRAPRSELAYVLGLGVSLLGALLACFWFWYGGASIYSVYSVPALSPVVTGTFALGRAVA